MLSRNIYSKASLARRNSQKFRTTTDSQSKSLNEKKKKLDLLYQFDNSLIQRKKKIKYSPYEESEIEVELPDDTIIPLNTGFEDNFNHHLGQLYLLGPFTLLNNFETTTSDDLSSDISFLGPNYGIIDDFETTTSDDLSSTIYSFL